MTQTKKESPSVCLHSHGNAGGGVYVFLKEKKEVTIFGNNWAARLLANASKASW